VRQENPARAGVGLTTPAICLDPGTALENRSRTGNFHPKTIASGTPYRKLCLGRQTVTHAKRCSALP
jgi:hypothetical protein